MDFSLEYIIMILISRLLVTITIFLRTYKNFELEDNIEE